MIRGKVKSYRGRFLLLSEQEKALKISFNTHLSSTSNKTLIKERNQFVHYNPLHVSFSIISNNHLFSLVSSFVPFFNHNDANRTLMGIGMQKQAVILYKKESPIVNSGNLNQFLCSSSFFKVSHNSGFLTFVSEKKIVLKNSFYFNRVKVNNKVSWAKFISKLKLKSAINASQIKVFLRSDFSKFGNNTFNFSNIFANKKRRVNSGEHLTGDFISNHLKLGIGRNLFLSYMSWRGYNFEDAIVINETLVNQDLFVSYHVKKLVIFILSSSLGKV